MTKKIEKIDKIICDANIYELDIVNASDKTSIGEFEIKHTEDGIESKKEATTDVLKKTFILMEERPVLGSNPRRSI